MLKSIETRVAGDGWDRDTTLTRHSSILTRSRATKALANMLHFTCDLCGRSIEHERYIARVEVAPAFDPEAVSTEDLDADHLESVADSLEQLESTGDFEIEGCGPKKFRFDLCPQCWQRYSKDPLGRESLRRLNFSQN